MIIMGNFESRRAMNEVNTLFLEESLSIIIKCRLFMPAHNGHALKLMAIKNF